MQFQYPYDDSDIKVFYKKEKYLELHEWGMKGELFFTEIKKTDIKSKKKIIYKTYDDLQEKILINYHREMFHCFLDVLSTILYEHEKNKNILFLINIHDMDSAFFKEKYNLFFFNLLNKMKINYDVLSLPKNNVIHISNFYSYNKYLPITYNSVALIEKVTSYLSENKQPTKKVYVSRKNTSRVKTDKHLFGDKGKTGLLFPDDNRLDNEIIMENFFKTLGFEIICPEDFGSFEDQIKYFSSVKILAGVTGAGLLNSIFMPRGGTIFELSTPLAGNGIESLHHFYKETSFVKQHKFMSITNFRNSQYIIDSIKKDKWLVKFLND